MDGSSQIPEFPAHYSFCTNVINTYMDAQSGKPSDRGPVCLPVHGVHKFDLVVEQGRFAGDHGSPVLPGLANIAVVLYEREGT